MERHAQYINRGELAGRRGSQLGNSLGIRQRVVSNCIVHHCFFPFPPFLFLLHSFSLLLLLLYFIIIIVSIIFYFSY